MRRCKFAFWVQCAALLAPAEAFGAPVSQTLPAKSAPAKASPAKPAAPTSAASPAKAALAAAPVAMAQAQALPAAAPRPAPEASAGVHVAPSPTPTSAPVAAPVPDAAASSAAGAPAAAPGPALETAPGPDWLSQSEVQAGRPEPMQRWPLVLATLLMLAAGGAFLALRVRQGQAFWPGGVCGQAIEILAVKTLGHKHKLVLVETCGERLLLSATEREVRLISHVSSQEGLAIEAQADARQLEQLVGGMEPRARQAPLAQSGPLPGRPQPGAVGPAGPAAPAATQGAQSVPSLSAEALYEGAARSMDVEEQDDDLDEPPQAASPEASGALASDVAGLARWRQAAAQGAETWGKQV